MPPSVVVPTDAPRGECRAVVDVGTNSVKLLVARVLGSHIEPVLERSIQSRLGEGFFSSGELKPGAIARTADAVAGFREEAMRHQPARFRVIATAAAREARNPDQLKDALRVAAGVEIEIISGHSEADLAFRGVCSTPGLENRPLLVADVGGGSTELILGTPGHRCFGRSFPLGAVRLWDVMKPSDAPTPSDLQRCRAYLDSWLAENVLPELRESLLAHSPAFVGVGGTASVLACMVSGLERFDRQRIEATHMDVSTLTTLTSRVWSLPLSERRCLLGLPPERADIILTGSAIYESLLRALGLPSMRPSTRGVRFAALLD